MTNGDKIRSMNDEALAQLLFDIDLDLTEDRICADCKAKHGDCLTLATVEMDELQCRYLGQAGIRRWLREEVLTWQ